MKKEEKPSWSSFTWQRDVEIWLFRLNQTHRFVLSWRVCFGTHHPVTALVKTEVFCPNTSGFGLEEQTWDEVTKLEAKYRHDEHLWNRFMSLSASGTLFFALCRGSSSTTWSWAGSDIIHHSALNVVCAVRYKCVCRPVATSRKQRAAIERHWRWRSLYPNPVAWIVNLEETSISCKLTVAPWSCHP